MVNDAYKVLFGRDDDSQKYSFSESDHPRADDGKFSSKGGDDDEKRKHDEMMERIKSRAIEKAKDIQAKYSSQISKMEKGKWYKASDLKIPKDLLGTLYTAGILKKKTTGSIQGYKAGMKAEKDFYSLA